MTKSLIIAEKPSVANDIAKILGGFDKYNDYYESEKYVLSSAIGHLVEIAAPEEHDVKRGKWSFTNLPMIPPYFALQPIKKTESRLKLLSKLIRRKDIKSLINACDAGREGELIFRLIIQYAKAKQPIERLWLQSMTPKAIRDAFVNLRKDEELIPLADAARCRSEADWLIGINGTRAMTAFNSKEGGFYLTTVGRVQTPTLSIVVSREEKIKQFISRDFWEVKAKFACKNGFYEGRWFDQDFKKDDKDSEKKTERIWSENYANKIISDCQGKSANVSEESKPSTSLSPSLFDLTSLQREANSKFGFSAKNTLGLAQALYERHKAVTYPRTDSRHLPEDYLSSVIETIKALSNNESFSENSNYLLKNKLVKISKRIFDNSKISDHFAIIPTTQLPKNLTEPQQKLYELIVRRFLAIFFPPAEYLITTRYTTIFNYKFKTDGKILLKPGWLSVYGKHFRSLSVKNDDNKDTLVPIIENEIVNVEDIFFIHLKTKPPARYSEATLLSAMEGAGKFVNDEDLRGAMAGKGLGTPATRAAVIEGLLAEKYLIREGREMLPTAKAFQLMTLLRGLGVSELTAPELTGGWEFKLSQMESGSISRKEFMSEIANMTETIVKRAKEFNNQTIPGNYVTLETSCPNCGGVVKENYRRFACLNCEFSISKTPGSRQFEINEVEEFLTNHIIGPLQGFRSKIGRPFAAVLKLSKDSEINNFKLEFDFGKQDDDENSEPIDTSNLNLIGKCPKCLGSVYELPLVYVCENNVVRPKLCEFRSSRIILQKEINTEQMSKLLTDGKTDLLVGFVSQRTRRPFKAFLVKGKDGKIAFEFEERKSKSEIAKSNNKKDDKIVKGNNPSKKKIENKNSLRKREKKQKKILKEVVTK